jgi:hypothetical protein
MKSCGPFASFHLDGQLLVVTSSRAVSLSRDTPLAFSETFPMKAFRDATQIKAAHCAEQNQYSLETRI